MTTALETLIVEIVRHADAPLSIPDLERRIDGRVEADTFDVRDAVWRLVAANLVEFTPRRQIVSR